MPHLLSPHSGTLLHKRSHCCGKPVHHSEEQPLLTNQRKPRAASEDPPVRKEKKRNPEEALCLDIYPWLPSPTFRIMRTSLTLMASFTPPFETELLEGCRAALKCPELVDPAQERMLSPGQLIHPPTPRVCSSWQHSFTGSA